MKRIRRLFYKFTCRKVITKIARWEINIGGREKETRFCRYEIWCDDKMKYYFVVGRGYDWKNHGYYEKVQWECHRATADIFKDETKEA